MKTNKLFSVIHKITGRGLCAPWHARNRLHIAGYNPGAMSRHRYRRIVFFFARVILGVICVDLILPFLGMKKYAEGTRLTRYRRIAKAYRELAIEMGGVLIKVGQFLSTRVDVLPAEITDELAHLQDEVPPEKFSSIIKVVESEFGAALLEKFVQFEEQPLAAASLGQVHRARISKSLAGDSTPELAQTVLDVVVKIQRPDIETLIATDMAALFTVGNWLKRYRPISRRADVIALLTEFKGILYEEIDYISEGRNAETFSRRFKSDPGVRVPEVYWSHTTKRVLTLENVWAIKITDYPSIIETGVDPREVASRLLSVYFKQIFEDGFFHADPHPGNLFVLPVENELPSGKRAWRLTFVDFGMVGRVPENTLRGLRELLIGVGTRDAIRVVNAYQTLGFLLPGADLELLGRAEAKMFERFWGMSMAELRKIDLKEIGEFAHEYRKLLLSMPFQIPHDFILLARTVAILSGMCTGLDPQFNVWEHLAPYAEDLLSREIKQGIGTWLEEVRTLLRALLSIPVKLDTILAKLDRGELTIQSQDILARVNQLEYALRQVFRGILFAAFLVGGLQLYSSGKELLAIPLLVFASSVLAWIFVSFGKNRSAK